MTAEEMPAEEVATHALEAPIRTVYAEQTMLQVCKEEVLKDVFDSKNRALMKNGHVIDCNAKTSRSHKRKGCGMDDSTVETPNITEEEDMGVRNKWH